MARIKKGPSAEDTYVSSIMNYDLVELEKFFNMYERLSENKDLIIDGRFHQFVTYLRTFNHEGIKKREEFRKKMIEAVYIASGLNPNSDDKEAFEIWFENALDINTDMLLADDIQSNFVWKTAKSSFEVLDVSDDSHDSKLSAILAILNSSSRFINNQIVLNLADIIHETEEDSTEYTLGLDEIDEHVRMVKSNLVVIGARPGVGKSMVMLKSAIETSRKGVKTLFVSLEMTPQQIEMRIINGIINENIVEKYGEDRNGLIEEINRIRKTKAYKEISENFMLFGSTMTGDNLISKVDEIVKNGKFEAVYIDYIQTAIGPSARMGEREAISRLTRGMKILAISNKILVVTGSQVSRSSEEMGLDMSSMYGSAGIEFDADIIIGLEATRRQGDFANIQFSLIKHREGGLPSFSYIVNYSTGALQFNEAS